MAEIVATSVITVLCEKLISGDLMKLARSEGISSQLKEWEKDLRLIEAVLADAGKRQITDENVQLWVNDLQDLAYDIDDVLDDFDTEALRRKLNHESHTSSSSSSSRSKVLKIIPTCCTNFNPHNMMYGRQMSRKLDEISKTLRLLVERKDKLGLIVNGYVERSDRTETQMEQTSLVDESKIVGREGDKEALLGKLLENDQKVSVVSIIGLGGIGKTTLAKLLYNDQKVNDYFELKAWVYVSEVFNVLKISMSIFEALGGENKTYNSLDLLHVALKEKLENKRFLLVLDDVWNKDYNKWEQLQSPLVAGAPGSKILVTTRNANVASEMDSCEAYHLKLVSDEDALSLFAQHSLGEKDFDNHPTLKLHGERIVRKCGRLPLALKTLGRVLKAKRDADEWENLLQSEIWDIHGENIIPALRLSYHHLPQHLKRLFAYCSLIPKGYTFEEKELVLMWMAQGFLSQPTLSGNNNSMESLGHRYFEELKSMSFFQCSKDDKLYEMHDLINDLATSVAGKFFCRVNDEMDVLDRNGTFDKVRHLSFVVPRSGAYEQLKKLQRARRLRSLLLYPGQSYLHLDNVLDELLSSLPYLRVLSLSHLIIEVVPKSIVSLKLLRFLDFSDTWITCLPEQVSDFSNLQSLLVSGCHDLSCFPESFVKLINLRHLEISDTPKVNKLPLGIGGLTSLQTLPKIIVEGTDHGFKISELEGLSDLQGQLSITGLENVIDPTQARKANLDKKKGLDVLELKWSNAFNDYSDEMIEYEVLEGLRPYHKLKNLKILSYKGARFPSWVGDPSFDRLTGLTLSACGCTQLPTLGHLPSLRKLFVEGMHKVKTVGSELLKPIDSFVGTTFPSLEVLEFNGMDDWEKWSSTGGDNAGTTRSFPCLREISLVNCKRLAQVSIGSIPSLQVLRINRCSQAVVKSMIGVSSTLVKLDLHGIEGLTQLHTEDLKHLGVLEELEFERCNELRYLWEQESEASKILVRLQRLQVSLCEKLVSFAEKEGDLGISMGSLKEVNICYCDAMVSYSCPSSVERLDISSCVSMTLLTFSTELSSPSTKSITSDCDNNIEPTPQNHLRYCLRYLCIYYCRNLKSFSHEYLQSLTSLEDLIVAGCPNMDYSFPCGSWPPKLRKLTIGYLNKPMSEWGPLDVPTSLVELTLRGTDSGVVSFGVRAEDARNTSTTATSSSSSFLLPPSLHTLILENFMDVESLSEVLQHMPCLKHLFIYNCPNLRDLPEMTSSLSVYVE